MTDRLAELGALIYAAANTNTATTNPYRLAGAGYIHAAYQEYLTWSTANPGVNPNRLSAKGRLFGYFYDYGFTPLSLFASGAQGAWYDPSDYSTLFEDAAGTIPITSPLEKPVGLMLDKSRGLVLGPELVTNGDFSNGTTGWTAANSANISVVDGECILTNTANSYGICYQKLTTVVGKNYLVSAVARKIVGTGAALQVSLTSTGSHFSETSTANAYATKITLFFTATSTTTYVRGILNNINGLSCGYDNISVRELPGNHCYQSTTTSRPTLSARKNKLVGTATLATQNATTTAVGHVLSFWGTGTVTLSGTATGSLVGTGVNDRVSLTFTPTAGTLTLTVTGSVLKAQLEEINETV